MPQRGSYQRMLDDSSRADPYPLYREPRETPVARQDDGSYVVSTYWEILHLLHDPRLSSDMRARGAALVEELDPAEGTDARLRRRDEASNERNTYLGELIEEHRRDPGGDMLSGLATDRGPDGRMRHEDLLATARLLLVAGHETTVNLISRFTLDPALLAPATLAPQMPLTTRRAGLFR